MRSVRVLGPHSLHVDEILQPEAKSGEAIVAIAYSGICGSDVELRAGRRPLDLVSYPVVPGHEWAGTVVRTGRGVDLRLIGRRVVGEGFLGCGRCAACHSDLPMFCQTGYHEIGFTENGAWAEELRIPAALLHPLPDDADLRSAAGLEPAACVADAVRAANLRAGERVVVVGAGSLGLLAVQLLRVHKPAELVVVEPDPDRRERALSFGATSSLHPDEVGSRAADFDASLEAAGCCDAAQTAADLLRPGGRVVLMGLPAEGDAIRASDLVTKRVELSTVFGATRKGWEQAVAAFCSGILDPGQLVTHEFPLTEAGTAIDLVESGARGVGKILLKP
jgi:2-desacetyl-2-hydroxyethyl bacteriochlorophyllide A dehydrogenase